MWATKIKNIFHHTVRVKQFVQIIYYPFVIWLWLEYWQRFNITEMSACYVASKVEWSLGCGHWPGFHLRTRWRWLHQSPCCRWNESTNSSYPAVTVSPEKLTPIVDAGIGCFQALFCPWFVSECEYVCSNHTFPSDEQVIIPPRYVSTPVTFPECKPATVFIRLSGVFVDKSTRCRFPTWKSLCYGYKKLPYDFQPANFDINTDKCKVRAHLNNMRHFLALFIIIHPPLWHFYYQFQSLICLWLVNE